MQVIPVLDLRGGVVVRGIGGRRSEYQPIDSRISESSKPLDVAIAFRREFGLDRVYIADLDAIAGGPPASAVFRELADAGFALMVDAGLRDAAGVAALPADAVPTVVVGSETLASVAALPEAIAACAEREVVFSLDLQSGSPIGPSAAESGSPRRLIETVWATGIRSLLILDLARVGAYSGVGSLDLVAAWKERGSSARAYVGGGVRDSRDLEMLASAGVDAVLVASALHDGRLTRADFSRPIPQTEFV